MMRCGNKEGKRDKMRENGTERKKITTEMLSVMAKQRDICCKLFWGG